MQMRGAGFVSTGERATGSKSDWSRDAETVLLKQRVVSHPIDIGIAELGGDFWELYSG